MIVLAAQLSGDPRISCVIPVHNGLRDLTRAVESVLGQCSGVQVILVDDASTDGSTELVSRLARDDDRIACLLLPNNRGQGYARNVGVAAAQSPYVTFLDQDDEHLPGWYDFAINALEKNAGVAAVKGDIELVGVAPNTDLTRGDPRWRGLVNSVIWNVVMHKVVYGVLGGSPTSAEFRTREGNEDIKLILDLVKHCQLATTDFRAARHYVKPNGAAAYFLSRTRLVGDHFEFIELTEAERKASLLPPTQSDSRNQAAINLDLLRDLLKTLKPPS